MNTGLMKDKKNKKKAVATANSNRPNAGKTSAPKSSTVYHLFHYFSR